MPIKYFVMRITTGHLNYNDVTAKYPDAKEGIDNLLEEQGYEVNEDGTVTKKDSNESMSDGE